MTDLRKKLGLGKSQNLGPATPESLKPVSNTGRSLRQAAKEGATKKTPEERAVLTSLITPKPAPQPVLNHAKEPAPKEGKKKPPPPFTSYIKIKASCGHEIEFGVWDPENKKDKFRSARRAKHEAKPCPQCREQQKAEKELKEKTESQSRKAEKKHARLEDERKTGGGWQGWKGRTNRFMQRLPAGSEHLSHRWDGEQWSGKLRVLLPELEGGFVTFHADGAPTHFRLCAMLTDQWAEWQWQNKQAMFQKLLDALADGTRKSVTDLIAATGLDQATIGSLIGQLEYRRQVKRFEDGGIEVWKRKEQQTTEAKT